jgi:hypothetical protein
MKNKFFTLLLLLSAFVLKAQVIFDPATYPGTLPEGMSIVTIGEKQYLQVILNGWNSVLDIPTVTLGTNQLAKCEFKYALCSATDDTLDINKINAVVQIMDTVNKIDNPWGEGLVPSSTAIAQQPASANMSVASATISGDMQYVHQIQFFGQQTISWGPTTGDTIWVGKIRAISKDPNIIMVPRELDTTELSEGMSIVDVEGTSYLQVILNGWNSLINIPEYTLQPDMTATCSFKYALCTATDDTLNLNQINGVVQIMDTINKVDNPWGEGLIPSSTAIAQQPVSGSMSVASATISGDMQYVHQIQFFGQQTISWGPTIGDTIWVGTIRTIDKSKPTTPSNLTANVSGSNVTLTWTASTDNIGVTGYIISQGDTKLDTITAATFVINGLADGTYTFTVVATDAAGNLSDAAMTNATVGGVGMNSLTDEKMNIYPNPAVSTLFIKGLRDIAEVNIINITGTVVMTVKNSDVIHVADLKEGLYLMKVKTSSDVYTTTFIKK